MKKYYPIELDKGEFQLGAEKGSPETNPTSNTFGFIPAGGGVTVKRLEVTENGTYTAPTGEAYSPVVVSVAGGGSSDFSTAKVTFVNNSNFVVTINCAHVDDDEGALVGAEIDVNNSLSLDGLLYKSMGFLAVYTIHDDPLTLAVEGNATVDGQFVDYTGDCTITIS